MTVSRRALWISMSRLWLDTELTADDLAELARDARASGLTREELEQVFLQELEPFLGPNLRSAAGVWSGFDPDWVCERAEGLRAEAAGARPPSRGVRRDPVWKVWQRVLDSLTG